LGFTLVLARDVERRLDELLGSIRIAFLFGNRSELEQNLGAADLDGRVGIGSTEHQKQSAEGSLGSIELSLFGRQRAEGMQNARMRRIDLGGEVELGESARTLFHLEGYA